MGSITYADADEELVEVDVTITVGVEKGHEAIGLGAGETDLDLAEAAVELLAVNLVVAIERVEVAESTSKATNGLSSTSFDLSADLLENYSKKKGLAYWKSNGNLAADLNLLKNKCVIVI